MQQGNLERCLWLRCDQQFSQGDDISVRIFLAFFLANAKTHVCICTYLLIEIHICTHTYARKQKCAGIDIHTHVLMHKYIHKHKHIHIYIHTYIQQQVYLPLKLYITVYNFIREYLRGTDTCNNHKVNEKQVPVREETL